MIYDPCECVPFLVFVEKLVLIGSFALANHKQAQQVHETFWWSVITRA